ncbi:MAG: PAS domain S-box protein [Anaerolineaceae bacterium]|nr:PAS domain S-box protein [Anaerolineaceae bacterium]
MENSHIEPKPGMAKGDGSQSFAAVDFIEEISDPVVILNLDKQIKKYNRAFTDIIGYDAEALGQYLCGYIIEKDKNRLVSAIDTGILQGQLKNFETRIITKEKKELPVLINLSASKSRNGGSSRNVIAIIRDISELKKTQNLLKENVEMNLALMDAISESVLLIDTNGIVLSANQTVAQRLGVTVENLLHKSFFNFLPPVVAEGRRRYVDQVILTKRPVRFKDERFGRKISNTFYPLLDESGEVYRLAALGFDNSDIELAEKEIGSLSRFPAENPNPVLRINRNGLILYANEAAQPLLALWNSGTGAFVPDVWGELISEVLESKTGRTVDTYVGERFYTFLLHPIAGEEYINIYGSDITLRREAEVRLQDYAERLAIINRLDHVISSNLDLQMVYDGFVKEMQRLVSFDRTSIMLIDESHQDYELVQQWTRSKSLLRSGEHYPLHGTAVEWVARHKSPLLEANLVEETGFINNERLVQEGIHSRILLPLIIQGQVTGVLSLASYQPDFYTEKILDIVVPLADQLAIAVQNSRLYAQVQKHSSELEQRVVERTFQLASANQELQASRTRLQIQFDRMPVGCLIYDQDFKIQSINPAGERIFGLSGQKTFGKDPLLLTVTDEAIPQVQEVFRRVKEGEEVNGVINENITFDGRKILVEWYNTPLFDEKGIFSGMIAMAQDVSARVLAEAAIENLNEDLKRQTLELQLANKELESFSYSVSHDLRAPLRAIDGFSRILIEDHSASLNTDALRYLNLVRNNTQQMGRLIDDLLAFSRLSRQFMNIQTLQPRPLVDEALNTLQNEISGRQVEVTIGALPDCKADPALLKLVFINLISNAFKYTRKCPLAKIEIGCQLQNGDQVYFIKDNGVGFDMQYADKLFGVFQRLHRAEEYEGTGVGLANVQRIIHRHGGRIWAEGRVNNGATFYFTLTEGNLTDE